MPLHVSFLSSLRSHTKATLDGTDSPHSAPRASTSGLRPTRFASASDAAPKVSLPFMAHQPSEEGRSVKMPPLSRRSFDVAPRLSRRQSIRAKRPALLGFHLSSSATAAAAAPKTDAQLSTDALAAGAPATGTTTAARPTPSASASACASTTRLARPPQAPAQAQVQEQAQASLSIRKVSSTNDLPGQLGVVVKTHSSLTGTDDKKRLLTNAKPLPQAPSSVVEATTPPFPRLLAPRPALRITTVWPPRVLETESPSHNPHRKSPQDRLRQAFDRDSPSDAAYQDLATLIPSDFSSDSTSSSRHEIMSDDAARYSKVPSSSSRPQQSEEPTNKWKRQGFIETLAPAVPPRRLASREAFDPTTTSHDLGGSAHSSTPSEDSAGIAAHTLQKGLLSSDTDDADGASLTRSSTSLDDSDLDYYDHTIVTAKRCVIVNDSPRILHKLSDILAVSRACSSAQSSVADLAASYGRARMQHSLRQTPANLGPALSSTDSLDAVEPERRHKTIPLDFTGTQRKAFSPLPTHQDKPLMHTQRARQAVQDRARQRDGISFETLQERIESIEANCYASECDSAMPGPLNAARQEMLTEHTRPLASPSTSDTGTSASPSPSSPAKPSMRLTGSILRRDTPVRVPFPQGNSLGLTFGQEQDATVASYGDRASAIYKSRHLRSAISSEALSPQPPPAARARRLHRASGNDLSLGSPPTTPPAPSGPRLRSETSTLLSSPCRSETSLPLSSEAANITTAAIQAQRSTAVVMPPATAKVKYSSTVFNQGHERMAANRPPPVAAPTASGSRDQGYTSTTRTRGASVSSHMSEGRKGRLYGDPSAPSTVEDLHRSHGQGLSSRRDTGSVPSHQLKSSGSYSNFRDCFEEHLAAELCGGTFLSRRPSSPISSGLADPTAGPYSSLPGEEGHLKSRSKVGLKSSMKATEYLHRTDTHGQSGPARPVSPARNDITEKQRVSGRFDTELPSRKEQSGVMAKSSMHREQLGSKDGKRDGEERKSRPATPETSPTSSTTTSPNSPKSRWWKRGGKRASQLGKSFPSIKGLGSGGSGSVQSPEPLVISSPLTPVQTPGTPTRLNASASDGLPPLRSPLGHGLLDGLDAGAGGSRTSVCGDKYVATSASDSKMIGTGRLPPSPREMASPVHQQRSSFTGHRLPYWPSFGSKKGDSGHQPGSDGHGGVAGGGKSVRGPRG